LKNDFLKKTILEILNEENFQRRICAELQQPMKFISPSKLPVKPLAKKPWKMLRNFSLDSLQTACLDQKIPKHNPIHWLWSNVVHRKQRPSPNLNLDTGAIFPSWFYQTVGGVQSFRKWKGNLSS
jgi:hypothetical protein